MIIKPLLSSSSMAVGHVVSWWPSCCWRRAAEIQNSCEPCDGDETFSTHHFLFNCHIHLLNASTFQLASWFHCDLPTPSCITIAEASLPPIPILSQFPSYYFKVEVTRVDFKKSYVVINENIRENRWTNQIGSNTDIRRVMQIVTVTVTTSLWRSCLRRLFVTLYR